MPLTSTIPARTRKRVNLITQSKKFTPSRVCASIFKALTGKGKGRRLIKALQIALAEWIGYRQGGLITGRVDLIGTDRPGSIRKGLNERLITTPKTLAIVGTTPRISRTLPQIVKRTGCTTNHPPQTAIVNTDIDSGLPNIWPSVISQRLARTMHREGATK